MRFFILALLSVGLVSCSGGVSNDPLPKSKYERCLTSDACSPGERCRNGFCEDIYYPDRTRKKHQ